MLRYLLFIWLLAPAAWAQTDSVLISGRIRNLTPQLYRQSPNVLISRNNMLRSEAELIRPAPLNPDGTFAVKMPLILGQEEMSLAFGPVRTAFLAAPGTLTITLDADSLFRSAVPFTFGGVNAQVNRQFARYKAFEARQNPVDATRLSEQVSGQSPASVFSRVYTAYAAAFRKFRQQGGEAVFPLVEQWIGNTNRYNAASFVYDMASAENRKLPPTLTDSLRPAADPILTAARAVSVGRLASYVVQHDPFQTYSLPVGRLASLMLRYGRDLTAEEKGRLEGWQAANSARASDMRYLQRILQRSPDTLQRLVSFETMADKARSLIDTPSVQMVMATWLANGFQTSSIRNSRLLYEYGRPQLTDTRVIQSLDELYTLAVADSARFRRAIAGLNPKTNDNAELATGILISENSTQKGGALLDTWLSRNRSRLVYVFLWTLSDEENRRLAALAQQLREQYAPSELSLLYVTAQGDAAEREQLLEYLIRNNLRGDHILATAGQLQELMMRLGAGQFTGAFLLNRDGKTARANTFLPDDNAQLTKLIDRLLR